MEAWSIWHSQNISKAKVTEKGSRTTYLPSSCEWIVEQKGIQETWQRDKLWQELQGIGGCGEPCSSMLLKDTPHRCVVGNLFILKNIINKAFLFNFKYSFLLYPYKYLFCYLSPIERGSKTLSLSPYLSPIERGRGERERETYCCHYKQQSTLIVMVFIV